MSFAHPGDEDALRSDVAKPADLANKYPNGPVLVLQLLNKNQPLEYRFTGGVNLDSSLPLLGAVDLPFDRSGQIRIQK